MTFLFAWLAVTMAVQTAELAAQSTPGAATQELRVAVYQYLPQAAYGLENLETAFEIKYPNIDLDLELIDPYEDEGLARILNEFDVGEIDLARLDDLLTSGGADGAIDRLPEQITGPTADSGSYVGPAQVFMSSGGKPASYVVPHWVCGNFFAVWSGNKQLSDTESFSELVQALDPAKGRELLVDFAGKSTLGELYADAVLDLRGIETAKKHLVELGRKSDGSVSLDDDAVSRVLQLFPEIRPELQDLREQYHSYGLTWQYPRLFVSNPNAALLGYSERLFYAQRERQLGKGKADIPNITADELVVRPFSFGDGPSQGTPMWIDGFVVPKGRLEQKREAIEAFLHFVRTDDGYECFARPEQYGATSYLLPALESGYTDELADIQPALKKYRDALDGSLPIATRELYHGVKEAGKRLGSILPKP